MTPISDTKKQLECANKFLIFDRKWGNWVRCQNFDFLKWVRTFLLESVRKPKNNFHKVISSKKDVAIDRYL